VSSGRRKPERGTRDTIGEETPVVMPGMAGLVMCGTMRGITADVTGEITGTAAGRVNRQSSAAAFLRPGLPELYTAKCAGKFGRKLRLKGLWPRSGSRPRVRPDLSHHLYLNLNLNLGPTLFRALFEKPFAKPFPA